MTTPPPYGPVPPPHGYPPPGPPVTNRIPADQPFILRPSAGKRAIQFGAIGLILLTPIGCVLGLVASDSGGAAAAVIVLVLAVVLFGGLFTLQVWLLTSGGPVLAVGPYGLWIKTRPTRGQAIWLPWEGIERVYRRRWLYEKMLCVKPRDPRTTSGLGGFTAIDSGVQQLFFGTGFIAPITFSDRREAEILGALAHFSAGRVRIE